MSRTARLGAFMLASLAILALGIFIIGDKKYLFTSTYSLRAKFTNVAGLSTGADVRVGGVHTGTVTALLDQAMRRGHSTARPFQGAEARRDTRAGVARGVRRDTQRVEHKVLGGCAAPAVHMGAGTPVLAKGVVTIDQERIPAPDQRG